MYIFNFFSTGKCLTTLLLFTFCLTCDNRPTKPPKTHTFIFMKKNLFPEDVQKQNTIIHKVQV